MNNNDYLVVLYNKDREPTFTFSPYRICGENIYFSIDVSISWYHLLLYKSISFKRISCIMKFLEELHELKRNEAIVTFPGCLLSVSMSNTGSLCWKIELQDTNLEACFYLDSDITFLPEVLSQIRSCKPCAQETEPSENGVDLYFHPASTAITPFDSLDVDMKMSSRTVSVNRRASVFQQDWNEFCTGVQLLLKQKWPFTFSPLGDFMFIRLYDNYGNVYLDCDISDFCYPSNQLKFTRRVNNFEDFVRTTLTN